MASYISAYSHVLQNMRIIMFLLKFAEYIFFLFLKIIKNNTLGTVLGRMYLCIMLFCKKKHEKINNIIILFE